MPVLPDVRPFELGVLKHKVNIIDKVQWYLPHLNLYSFASSINGESAAALMPFVLPPWPTPWRNGLLGFPAISYHIMLSERRARPRLVRLSRMNGLGTPDC